MNSVTQSTVHRTDRTVHWRAAFWHLQRPLQQFFHQHRFLQSFSLGLSPRDHVRPALKELHWLPVAHRIRYKVALLMFMVHDNRCPVYGVPEWIRSTVTSSPVRQRLRSASSLDFIVPRTRTMFGDRAFSVAGPTWNSLPESVRSAETLASFKGKLKTYLFNIFNLLLSLTL